MVYLHVTVNWFDQPWGRRRCRAVVSRGALRSNVPSEECLRRAEREYLPAKTGHLGYATRK